MNLSGGTFTASRLGRAGAAFFRSFWLKEYASPASVSRALSPAVGATAYKDRVFNEQSTSSITDFDWQIGYDLDRPETQEVVFTSSNEAVITPPSVLGGRWTAVANGTATLTAQCTANTQQRSVTVTTATQLGQTDFTFATGSAAKHASDAVDTRLAGKTPATAMPMFTTLNAATQTYVRNTGNWASDINLTCVPASDQYMNGCLISPDILVCAAHFVPNGTLHFVTPDNTVIARATDASALIGGDHSIVRLASPLPASITPAKILPASYSTKVPLPTQAEFISYPWRAPLACVNRERKLYVNDSAYFWDFVGGTYWTMYPVNATRLSFATSAVSGDSGSPAFLFINSSPVCVFCWFTSTCGGLITNKAALTAAIAALGGEQPTEVDLSSFNTYA